MFALFPILIAFGTAIDIGNADRKLLTVNVFVRHGERYPLSEVPNLPQFTNSKIGMLTKRGMMVSTEVGQIFRGLYWNFLNESNASPASEMHASTSLTNRTMDTAKCFLEGFMNESRDSLKIPIESSSKSNMLLSYQGCPKQLDKLLSYTNHLDWESENKELYQKVKRLTGLKNMTNLQFTIFANAMSMTHHGVYSPNVTESERIALERVFNDYHNLLFERCKYAICPSNFILQMVLEQCLTKDNSTKKLNLYFTHDDVLLSIMSLLGPNKFNRPAFNDAIIFECYEDPLLPSSVGIKVSYMGIEDDHGKSHRVKYSLKSLTISPCLFTSSICDCGLMKEYHQSHNQWPTSSINEECQY